MRQYRFTMDVEVEDPTALYEAARLRFREDHETTPASGDLATEIKIEDTHQRSDVADPSDRRESVTKPFGIYAKADDHAHEVCPMATGAVRPMEVNSFGRDA